MRLRLLAAAAILVAAAAPAFAQEGARVYFITPQDGATVSGPVTVRFGLSGMGVAPAGVEREGTGHHHLLIDRPPFGEAAGDAEAMANGLPADDAHRHFGAGQTETVADLPPGRHTLQLVLGDAFHAPHDPVVASEVIEIVVE